ncbi:MAG TPA: hypothetical protein VK043_04850 [Burkholderiales bacterium]|nr:hypothetical protein [Burkholderiales bacterium]
MPKQPIEDIKGELYLTLVLLDAEPMLLRTLASWSDGTLDERAVLEDVRNWNEAKMLELKEWLPTLTGEALDRVQESLRHYEEARAISP